MKHFIGTTLNYLMYVCVCTFGPCVCVCVRVCMNVVASCQDETGTKNCMAFGEASLAAQYRIRTVVPMQRFDAVCLARL